MNFFEHQDRARRKTKLLVFYFTLAVLCIIAGIYFVSVPIHHHFFMSAESRSFSIDLHWWQPELLFWISSLTLLLVILGSAFMVHKLSTGGSAVAEMLGGEKLDPNTKDPHEQRLRNVVEEMSIAAGTPVPEIYVLKGEESINAFAAGTTPSDAAIGVTRGTLTQLDRDELQGVIAHEFSHILQGDMRINIRLMGILHGILLIALVGQILMRMNAGARIRQSRNGQAGLAFVAMGLALLVIGYIGVFFGKLIKSALARQREFLADAAAVQFTRNPRGIAGALKKIGGYATGSTLETPQAETASHLFFGNALSRSWFNAMATHPPLSERIRRIDSSFKETEGFAASPPSDHMNSEQLHSGFASQTETLPRVSNPEILRSVGQPTGRHLSYAQNFINHLPSDIHEISHDPSGAKALIYALLLSSEPQVLERQQKQLSMSSTPEVMQRLKRIAPSLEQLGPQARLPMIDLALPALRKMSPSQRSSFISNLTQLIRADEQFDLFEMTLTKVVGHHLSASNGKGRNRRTRFHRFSSIREKLVYLLSALAHVGQQEFDRAQSAFETGWKQVSSQMENLLPANQIDVSTLSRVLDDLAQASPSLKQEILQSCVATAGEDGQLTIEEAELLRAIGDTMNCPIPPMINT